MVSPEDKLSWIRRSQQAGQLVPLVAFGHEQRLALFLIDVHQHRHRALGLSVRIVQGREGQAAPAIGSIAGPHPQLDRPARAAREDAAVQLAKCAPIAKIDIVRRRDALFVHIEQRLRHHQLPPEYRLKARLGEGAVFQVPFIGLLRRALHQRAEPVVPVENPLIALDALFGTWRHRQPEQILPSAAGAVDLHRRLARHRNDPCGKLHLPRPGHRPLKPVEQPLPVLIGDQLPHRGPGRRQAHLPDQSLIDKPQHRFLCELNAD